MNIIKLIKKYEKKNLLLSQRDSNDKHIQPKNCVELIIFDNDGPEGYYERLRFERSITAVKFLRELPDKEIEGLNFGITNYWK